MIKNCLRILGEKQPVFARVCAKAHIYSALRPSIRLRGIILTFMLFSQFSLAQEEETGSWQSFSPMPSSRQEVGVGVADGKIYVVGGFSSGSSVNTVERYDPKTDQWESIAALPAANPLNHVGVATANGLLFVIGGLRQNFGAVDTVFCYAPSTESWSQKASMPTARGALGVATTGNIIYAAGGSPSARENDFAAYDSVADQWTVLPDMPTPRNHFAAAAVDNRFFALSGRSATLGGLQSAVEEYDPASNSWSSRTDIPTPRAGIAAALLHRRIYVFGGEGNDSNTSGVFDEVEEYNPESDSWRSMAPMPNPRHGIGAAALSSMIFIPGGGPIEGFSDSNINDAFTPPAPDNPFSILENLGNNWRESDWLGLVNDTYYPWVYHLDHGWWYFVYRKQDSAIFVYDLSLQSWLYTGETFYPYLFALGQINSWLYYLRETADPRIFVNLLSGSSLRVDRSQ